MKATIKVTGYIDNEENSTIQMEKGSHIRVGDKHFIEYTEINEESKQETTNEIEFHKERVIVKREGQVNSTMVFDPKEVTSFVYETEYGTFQLETRTKLITIYNQGDYLRFYIEYQLEASDELLSQNSLIIEVQHN